MQKSDHVIVADLSLSLPLRQRPYLGRAHRLGHHDGVVPHGRGIGHSARLRQVRASVSRRHAPAHNRDRHVLDLRRNPRHSPLTMPNGRPRLPRRPVGGGFHLLARRDQFFGVRYIVRQHDNGYTAVLHGYRMLSTSPRRRASSALGWRYLPENFGVTKMATVPRRHIW